jgi:ABC-type multidrug transport system fused ATPase/permease subunit
MIQDEQDEAVNVDTKTYWRLLKMSGGWFIFFLVNVSMWCYVFCSIAGDFYTQQWAYQSQEEQSEKFEYYVIIIFSFSFGVVLFIILRVLMLLLMSLRSARIAHNYILKHVMQAPINLFYDVTPIGKILNRFSKDLQVLDNSLCFNMGSFLAQGYNALAALVVATIAVRWILVAVLFMIVSGVCLFKFVLTGYKDLNRIESVTKSPMLSLLQET